MARQTDAEGHSPALDPLRRLYSTARWKRLRMDVFERDQFTCQCGCGHIEADTAQLVADHKIPHRGDPRLFWDPGNLQTLRAHPCHSKWKQAQERAARFY